MLNAAKNTNLPDLLFVHYCNREFGINRGIYNTIDLWFYEKGHTNIKERRKKILSFLKFVYSQTNKNDKIIFGNGGLKSKLVDYSNNSVINKSKVVS
ncbi:hypothetical protein DCC39_06955 [Pueribacillus theae]|uniref:Uncharacterized protein n=1 Tax=Pueribacillus theae TaxID=2171751 RepID=A0A2U1K3S3_9BACI|nr:hypothetical protein DCC39_06955 [Pueribacillus theae]